MKIGFISRLCIILLVNVKGLHSTKGGPKMKNVLTKEQVLNLIDESIRQMLDPTCNAQDDNPTLKRYITLANALGYCLQKGDITKPELVSCLNNVLTSGGLDPPPQLLKCIGEYIMCTARSCLAALRKSEEEDDEMSKCLVVCLPRGLLCIARSDPVPERFSGL